MRTWSDSKTCESAPLLGMMQRRRKPTQPPPKEDLLENFSGLKEKLSSPVVDTRTLLKPGKPYPPPKSFLCGPRFFLQRQVLHWSKQGGVWFLFPSDEVGTLLGFTESKKATGISKGLTRAWRSNLLVANAVLEHFLGMAAPTSIRETQRGSTGGGRTP